MTHLVVAESSGQLGNQLLLFAHLLAVAEELGLTVHNLPFAPYRDHFVGPAEGRYPRFAAGTAAARLPLLDLIALLGPDRGPGLAFRGLRRALRADNHLFPYITCATHSPGRDINLIRPEYRRMIEGTRPTLLFGWRYRSYGLFTKHQEKIRAFFAFRDARRTSRFLAKLREEHDFVVALHVRQGDYATFEGGRYFLQLSEYLAAARHAVQHIDAKAPVVVLCSNASQDIPAAAEFALVPGPGRMIEDMQVLAMSDLIIAVPSTFSRWASFLGRVPIARIARETPLPQLSTGCLPAPAQY